MKTSITDFKFTFKSYGHYIIYYHSPKTTTCWSRLITDMTIIDEFKGTETSDHTQKRLNELKYLIKNY